MASKPTNPGPGWFTRESLADIFGVGVTQIDRRHRKLAPAEAVKIVNRRPHYLASAIITALVAEAEGKAKIDAARGDALLLSGSDSPALERYRTARATLAELDVSERKNDLVPSAILQRFIFPALKLVREAGRQLEIRFGAEAGDMLREAIDEATCRAEAAYFQLKGETSEAA